MSHGGLSRLAGRLHQQVEDGRGLTWPRWVSLVCTACAVAVVLGALSQRGDLVPPGVAWLPALLALAPWLVLEATGHRSVPAALFVGCVVGGTYWLLLLDPVSSDVAPFLLVLVCLEVGAVSSLRVTALTVAACIAPMFPLELSQDVGGWWVWLPGLAAGAIGGVAAQAQVRLLANERASRTALAERMAAEQRREVAREVHDVVAHSLSVTLLHVTAARHALEADGDVDDAVDSLRDAERVGRQAMGDIRRTVGLLDPTGGDTRPLPGLDDLPALVDEFRAAGLEVEAELGADLGGLAPNAALAVYRVAQETLANVAKHTPGAQVTLAVEVGREGVALRAVSTLPAGAGPSRADGQASAPAAAAGAQAGGGRGVQGMRQRIELLGGYLDAGPTGGGWRVEAHIPSRPPDPGPAHPADGTPADEAAGPAEVTA
jgi:signal transduction histidine kinase